MTRASGKTKGMTEIEKKTIEMMRTAEAAREKLDASTVSLSSLSTPLSVSSDTLDSSPVLITRWDSGPVTWVGGSHDIRRTISTSTPEIISGGASARESVSEPVYAESFLPHLVHAKEEGTRKKIEMDTVVIDRGVATSQGLEHADMVLGLKVKYAKEGSLPMDSAFIIMKDIKAEAEKIEKEKELEEKIRADERKKAIADALKIEEEYGCLALFKSIKEKMESERREATIRADDSSSPSSSPSISLLSDPSFPEPLPLTTAPALTAGGTARFLVLERKFIDDSGYGPSCTDGELLLAIDKIVGVEYDSAYERGVKRLAITYQVEDTTKTLSILTDEEQQRVLKILKASRF